MCRLQTLIGFGDPDMAKISTAMITGGSGDDTCSRASGEQRSQPAERNTKTEAVKKSRGFQRPTKAYLSNYQDSWSAVALTAVGFPCHFPRSTHTHTDACKVIIQYCLSIVPFQPGSMSCLAPEACISASH